MFQPSVAYLGKALLDLFYPHTCAGCGSALLPPYAGVCASCLSSFPATGFLDLPDNPVAQIFWGRLPVTRAAACCYFNKKTRVQSILHQIKYHYRKDAGFQLGQWMGAQLQMTSWPNDIDLLLPMPLHRAREEERGYNQAALLCEGISSMTGLQTAGGCIIRQAATNSQTRQDRAARWENMQGVFKVADPGALQNQKLVLVDDVITTGATLEAMGAELMKVPGIRLHILCFAFTQKH